MGGWFSKWSFASTSTSKVITDPQIIKQFEDQIYGIEMTPRPKQEVVHQPVKIINNSVI